MISILLVKHDDYDGLVREWDAWIAHYGKPPALILAHDDLPYGLDGAPGIGSVIMSVGELMTFRGVTVVSLGEFRYLHGADLGDRGSE